MANYRAVANGNWGSLSTWQDDSLGYFFTSSVLPGSSDDVYSNNFTVNINTSFEVSSLNNTAFTPPTTLGAMSIPPMTSNTSPSGIVSSSNNSATAWQAFDRSTLTNWVSSTIGSGSLTYNFPTGKIIKRYGIRTVSDNNNNIRTWTFQGSNDGSTWTTLDTQTNFVTVSSTFYSFDVSSNITSYTYYRINITAAQGGGNLPQLSEVEMSEVTNLYGSIATGGTFNFNSGSISGSCIGTTPITVAAANLITITATSGSVSFSSQNPIIPTTLDAIKINHTGSCDFYITSPTIFATGGTNATLNKTSTGTIYINSNLIGGSNSICFLSSAGNTIIVGDIIAGASSGNFAGISQTGGNLTITGSIRGGRGNSSARAINFSGNFLTIQGDVYGGSAGAEGIVTSGVVNIINGNVIAGSTRAISSTTSNQININGDVIASANAVGVSSTSATAVVLLNGNMFNNTGTQAIYCQNLFLSDTGTTQAQFSTSGSQDRTLYSANTFPNLPSSSIVRSTTLYGPGNELSGSIIMPDPANVRYGVPTDNTTGSALLSAETLFDEIVISDNPVAVRLRECSTTDTFGYMLTAFKK